ncbi:hypothetical protein GCM10010178_39800 [Lentzea flava]|uniref:Uncharacterized protein n=1 Tax=Lentzea flava TaxID=103732 RepID=A0ABQ2ULD2_9PSEU|nr:hypothetical protein GCM10010178_39800 [Lentzea flava]
MPAIYASPSSWVTHGRSPSISGFSRRFAIDSCSGEPATVKMPMMVAAMVFGGDVGAELPARVVGFEDGPDGGEQLGRV